MTIQNQKELDALVCDEVNVKAYNRLLGYNENNEEIVLQYVRSLNSYNWRVGGVWIKNADDSLVNNLLTDFKCTCISK